MDLQVVNEWMKLAENCLDMGNISGMRACGRQMLEEEPASLEAMAIIAEASVYLEDFGEAEGWLEKLSNLPAQQEKAVMSLRGLLAMALYHGANFELTDAMEAYEKFFAACKAAGDSFAGCGFGGIEQDWTQTEQKIIMRGYSFYADTCLLAGETEKAAGAAFKVSEMAGDALLAASYFSKGLFISNYRYLDSYSLAARHGEYGRMYPRQAGFSHDVQKRRSAHNIRVGYISPDFRFHAAAYFFTALLKNASHQEFTVYGYSTCREDHITRRFEKMADHWRNLAGLSTEEIARIIYNDHIDILVDLSGHSNNNCLPVMAYRPAPVQVSGIGYINTTGLPVIDYFLTDKCCMPLDSGKTGFTELPLRLEGCHLCYSPETMRKIHSLGHDAPAMKNGYVTFGSFNSFAKVTDEMLLAWRNILQAVPESRLVIKCKTCSVPSGRELVQKRFRAIGGNPDRLELRPFSRDYLMEYRDIDIILDTAPYNGGLTTCDALYMGVPVITLKGKTHGSRYGATILAAAGLQQLVADSMEAYIAKAAGLAEDAAMLGELHRELPDRVRCSRLMDAKEYMQELEQEYRRIWRLYCRKQEM